MTPYTQALQRLLEALEAGETPNDDLIIAALGHRRISGGWYVPRLVKWIMDPADIRAMGAAKALHDALLPGWINRMDLCGQGAGVSVCHVELSDWETDFAICVDNAPVDNPARAWLIAIIRAVMAGER